MSTKGLEHKLVDKGLLIEAGFVGYMAAVHPRGVSEMQFSETRLAFFAGAQHLFGSIMQILEPGSEPTEADLRRMDLIHRELEEFAHALTERIKGELETTGGRS